MRETILVEFESGFTKTTILEIIYPMNEWNPKLTTKTIKSLYLANKKVLT